MNDVQNIQHCSRCGEPLALCEPSRIYPAGSCIAVAGTLALKCPKCGGWWKCRTRKPVKPGG